MLWQSNMVSTWSLAHISENLTASNHDAIFCTQHTIDTSRILRLLGRSWWRQPWQRHNGKIKKIKLSICIERKRGRRGQSKEAYGHSLESVAHEAIKIVIKLLSYRNWARYKDVAKLSGDYGSSPRTVTTQRLKSSQSFNQAATEIVVKQLQHSSSEIAIKFWIVRLIIAAESLLWPPPVSVKRRQLSWTRDLNKTYISNTKPNKYLKPLWDANSDSASPTKTSINYHMFQKIVMI